MTKSREEVISWATQRLSEEFGRHFKLPPVAAVVVSVFRAGHQSGYDEGYLERRQEEQDARLPDPVLQKYLDDHSWMPPRVLIAPDMSLRGGAVAHRLRDERRPHDNVTSCGVFGGLNASPVRLARWYAVACPRCWDVDETLYDRNDDLLAWTAEGRKHCPESKTASEGITAMSIKMLREDLVRRADESRGWSPEVAAAVEHLIDAIDRDRPLGPDGKHGDRHTVWCGCDDVEWSSVFEADIVFMYAGGCGPCPGCTRANEHGPNCPLAVRAAEMTRESGV